MAKGKGTAPVYELHRARTSLQTAHQAVSSASGASSLGGDVEGGAEDDDADSSDMLEYSEADTDPPPYSSDMFEYSEADADPPPAAEAAADCAALAPPPPLNGLLASPAP